MTNWPPSPRRFFSLLVILYSPNISMYSYLCAIKACDLAIKKAALNWCFEKFNGSDNPLARRRKTRKDSNKTIKCKRKHLPRQEHTPASLHAHQEGGGLARGMTSLFPGPFCLRWREEKGLPWSPGPPVGLSDWFRAVPSAPRLFWESWDGVIPSRRCCSPCLCVLCPPPDRCRQGRTVLLSGAGA